MNRVTPIPIAPDVRDTIKSHAADRAKASWRMHQNPDRGPEPSDWPSLGRVFTPTETGLFFVTWRSCMNELKTAHNAFIAYEHQMGDPRRIQSVRFEESVVLEVLGEVKARLGALGQSTRLFRDLSEFSWEERKPPTKPVGNEAFQESREIGYEIAREVRARVVEAVEGVYRPESLTLTVGPIARVEETREEPFTAILVTAESLITRPVTLAVYAERL